MIDYSCIYECGDEDCPKCAIFGLIFDCESCNCVINKGDHAMVFIGMRSDE